MSNETQDAEYEPVIERLENLLDALDSQFTGPYGLMQFEVDARTLARQLVDLDKVYVSKYGEHLFLPIALKGATAKELARTAERVENRLHDLEGQEGTIKRLLDIMQQFGNDLREMRQLIENNTSKPADLRGK